MAEEEIYRVTCKMARDIIDGSNPERVKVYCEDPDGYFVAVDNSSGEAFTEDFTTGEDAIEWLTSDITAEEIRARHRPKYVPFDLSKEEDRLRLCGSWVKSKRHPDECRSICGVSSHLVFISGLTPGSNAKEFLRDFTFLDGSPCGKPANGQQME